MKEVDGRGELVLLFGGLYCVVNGWIFSWVGPLSGRFVLACPEVQRNVAVCLTLTLAGGLISRTDIACCKFLRYWIAVGLPCYSRRFLMTPTIFSIGSWMSREPSAKLLPSFWRSWWIKRTAMTCILRPAKQGGFGGLLVTPVLVFENLYNVQVKSAF